jgi:acetyl-CoA carboxylase carboxyltransferase component
VPKSSIVIVGNSTGAAMPCKAYDPRLIFAWPSAELAVMVVHKLQSIGTTEASSLKKSEKRSRRG